MLCNNFTLQGLGCQRRRPDFFWGGGLYQNWIVLHTVHILLCNNIYAWHINFYINLFALSYLESVCVWGGGGRGISTLSTVMHGTHYIMHSVQG